MPVTVSERLVDWLGDVVPDARVVFTLPPAGGSEECAVYLYPLDVLPSAGAPAVADANRSPAREVRYSFLVTVQHADPMRAAEVLSTLVFTADTQADCEVDLQPLQPELWLALGTLPQPSLQLYVTQREVRSVSEAGRITQGVTVQLSAARKQPTPSAARSGRHSQEI